MVIFASESQPQSLVDWGSTRGRSWAVGSANELECHADLEAIRDGRDYIKRFVVRFMYGQKVIYYL